MRPPRPGCRSSRSRSSALRASTRPTAVAASAETRPQASNPSRGPYEAVTQPTIGAPIGVPPVKTSTSRPITRPRIAGSVPSCRAALTEVLKLSPNTPIRVSSSAKVQ